MKRDHLQHTREPIDWSTLPLLLDERETAKVLGCSLSFIRKSRTKGTLRNQTPEPPFVRVGGRIYYRVTELKVWAERLSS